MTAYRMGMFRLRVKVGRVRVKCGGKVLVIDGGFSKAYQKETGIAGYTLIYNSYGLILAAHEPFESTEVPSKKKVIFIRTVQSLNGWLSVSWSGIRM